jgi:hypothetical protein
MSKFKVGDRVVLVSTKECERVEGHRYDRRSSDADYLTLGEASVISSHNGYIAFFEDKQYGAFFKDLEHEHVFHSPLYQALS